MSVVDAGESVSKRLFILTGRASDAASEAVLKRIWVTVPGGLYEVSKSLEVARQKAAELKKEMGVKKVRCWILSRDVSPDWADWTAKGWRWYVCDKMENEITAYSRETFDNWQQCYDDAPCLVCACRFCSCECYKDLTLFFEECK